MSFKQEALDTFNVQDLDQDLVDGLERIEELNDGSNNGMSGRYIALKELAKVYVARTVNISADRLQILTTRFESFIDKFNVTTLTIPNLKVLVDDFVSEFLSEVPEGEEVTDTQVRVLGKVIAYAAPDYASQEELVIKVEDIVESRKGKTYAGWWNESIRQLVYDAGNIEIETGELDISVQNTLRDELESLISDQFESYNFHNMNSASIYNIVQNFSKQWEKRVLEMVNRKIRDNSVDIEARFSTEEEIAEMVSGVVYPDELKLYPDSPDDRIASVHMQTLISRQIRNFKTNPTSRKMLQNHITRTFPTAFMRPNSRAGLIAAQSISQIVSQKGLNSFHHAGIGAKNGFARMNALLSMPNKPSDQYVHFSLKGNPSLAEARELESYIGFVQVKDIATAEIFKLSDKDNSPINNVFSKTIKILKKAERSWRDQFQTYLSLYELDTSTSKRGKFEESTPWLIKLHLDIEVLFRKKISFADVADRIESAFKNKLRCVYQPMQKGAQFEVWIKNAESASDPMHFVMKAMKSIMNVYIRGNITFSGTLVEAKPMSFYVNRVFEGRELFNSMHIQETDEEYSEKIVVEMKNETAHLEGVTSTKVKDFIMLKTGIRDPSKIRHLEVPYRGHYIFEIAECERLTSASNPVRELRRAMFDAEVFTLNSVVKEEIEKEDGSIRIIFDQKGIMRKHKTKTKVLMDYFQSQSELKMFAPYDLTFRRSSKNVGTYLDISISKEFDIRSVMEHIQNVMNDMEVSIDDAESEDEDSTYYFTIGQNADVFKTLKDVVADYKDILEMSSESDTDNRTRITLKIKKDNIKVELAKKVLFGEADTEDEIIFESELGNNISQHVRIIAGTPKTVDAASAKDYTSTWSILTATTQMEQSETKASAKIEMNKMANEPRDDYESIMEYINPDGIITSNPMEIVAVLGIEAARAYVYGELVETAGNVGKRHISLVADDSTFMGVLSKLSEAGAMTNGEAHSVRAAYKSTLLKLVEGAAANYKDRLNSPTSQTTVAHPYNPQIKQGMSSELVTALIEGVVEENKDESIELGKDVEEGLGEDIAEFLLRESDESGDSFEDSD